MTRRLLVLDSAYSLRTLRARDQLESIRCRDLDGFFDHVWSVHPLAGADIGDLPRDKVGPVRTTELTPRHTFVEAPIGRHPALKWARPANFVAAQAGLYRYLARLISSEGISAIRVGDPYYQGLLGLRLARKHRIPLLVRINGNYDRIYETTGRRAFPRLFPSRRVEKFVERRVLTRADLVVAANEDNLAYALRNGATSSRTAVFRYGNLIDPRHFSDPATRVDRQAARDEVGHADRRLLVYTGRLDPVKHADHLIRILHRTRAKHPDVALVVIGDGPLRKAMQAEAASLGMADAVVFVGERPQAWIQAFLPSASIGVATHMGRALAETALAGLPIVAYDIDWHREIVLEGKTGALVPFPDEHRFSAAVVRLLDDPVASRRLGDAARAHTRTLLSPEALQETERATYQRLLRAREETLLSGAMNAPVVVD